MNTCSGLENPNPNPNLSRGGVSRPERRTDPPVGRISGWMARGQVTFPKSGPPLGQRARRMQIGKRCMATANHMPSYGGSSFRTESRAIRTWRACLPIDPPVGRIIQKRPASGSFARKTAHQWVTSPKEHGAGSCAAAWTFISPAKQVMAS